MSTLLEVKNLKKYFDTPSGKVHAVDDVSFNIEAGETLGVVGESGCGKSTLGRTIVHLLEPSSGKIIFDGKDISKPTKDELKEMRSEMQMIFQDPFSSLNPRMTVRNSIIEPMQIYKLYNGSKDRQNEKTLELMDTVGLARRLADSYPHELDGGRRQRIGIARALALDPKFVVCDEPVSALDVSIQAQILNLLQDLQEENNLTFVFITHDLSVVKHISDNICIMYLGQIVEMCPAKELFKKQYHPYSQALLSAIPIAKTNAKSKRIILKGEITSPIDPPPGCRFAKRCPYEMPVCKEKEADLIEVAPGHYASCHLLEQGQEVKESLTVD